METAWYNFIHFFFVFLQTDFCVCFCWGELPPKNRKYHLTQLWNRHSCCKKSFFGWDRDIQENNVCVLSKQFSIMFSFLSIRAAVFIKFWVRNKRSSGFLGKPSNGKYPAILFAVWWSNNGNIHQHTVRKSYKSIN